MATAIAGGAEFAWRHMERQGWKKGEGLGRNRQGMTDALKPKFKFDQLGMGHNRAEEFEFHWWDHVFNSAAKGITVNESQGNVTVEFKSDKSDISVKKLRRRMQKEIRNKLYSHFIKSGTLEGGKFTQENLGSSSEEVKDLSKIRTLTDEELVKACGGRTAHKGARHGQNMSAKLARVAEAERIYLEQLASKLEAKEEMKKNKERIKERLQPVVADDPTEAIGGVEDVGKKSKKKKKKDGVKEGEEQTHNLLDVVESKEKKKKRSENVLEPTENTVELLESKKKKRKEDLDSLHDEGDEEQPAEKKQKLDLTNSDTLIENSEEIHTENFIKKKKKSKKNKEKDRPD